VLAICLSLLAAAQPAEPDLVQTQEAASRVAAGSATEDASRLSRARAAHWAPQLRTGLVGKDEERSREGEFRLAPLRENDITSGRDWTVQLSWDFSQVVFAREETQLALAHAHLARLRREAATQAADLWIERRRLKSLPPDPQSCLALLRLTAALDTLTAGLFRDALVHDAAACAPGEK
jgi:hypothetical protein